MTTDTLFTAMQALGQRARAASRDMLRASSQAKNLALQGMAEALRDQRELILAANERDIQAAIANQLEPAMVDRLRISEKTLTLMAAGLQQIAAMPDPVGSLSPTTQRPNGMRISKMRVPLGVIGIIYESRPNVTIDAAALCLKSGNAAILRGGKEALHSNIALGRVVQHGLQAAGLPADAVQVIDTPDRAAVGHLITMPEYVDVIVPRGGKGLVARLSAESRVPMIMHLDGNCHVYIDQHADPAIAHRVAFNAKTYRYGVCGTMETLLVHAGVAATILPPLAQALIDHGVELRGCERTRALVPTAAAATNEDWATEYLAPILAIRIVDDIDAAMAHIATWSSGHTESIVTESLREAQRFQREVDSSSVYVNLPTVFADGYEYGLGAEIGISTNRLHARGPVGLEGLTTEKWVLTGEGQLRG